MDIKQKVLVANLPDVGILKKCMFAIYAYTCSRKKKRVKRLADKQELAERAVMRRIIGATYLHPNLERESIAQICRANISFLESVQDWIPKRELSRYQQFRILAQTCTTQIASNEEQLEAFWHYKAPLAYKYFLGLALEDIE